MTANNSDVVVGKRPLKWDMSGDLKAKEADICRTMFQVEGTESKSNLRARVCISRVIKRQYMGGGGGGTR